MNVSKAEKLLAAKKKLKEFQLSKLLQESSTKLQQEQETQQNSIEPPKTSHEFPTNLNDLSKDSNEFSKNSSKALQNSNDFSEIRLETLENIDDFSKTSLKLSKSSFEIPQNFVEPSDHFIEYSQNFIEPSTNSLEILQKSFEPSENSFDVLKSSFLSTKTPFDVSNSLLQLSRSSIEALDPSESRKSTVQHHKTPRTPQDPERPVDKSTEQSGEIIVEKLVQGSEKKLIENIEIDEDFRKVEKQQILEMASAVADVLTKNSEAVDQESDFVAKSQFFNSHLKEQKRIVNDLHVEINTYRSRIAELESKLSSQEANFKLKLTRELNPLREQLQIHAQTTGILIAEKAELTAALQQTQQTARQHSEEAADFSSKLKSSQSRVHELEKEILLIRGSNEEIRRGCEQIQNNYGELENKVLELRKEKEDLSLENSELKQKLNLKKTELISVQQNLQETTALLSLSELRVKQMKDASQTECEKRASLLLEEELSNTKEALRATTEEREVSNMQYQNYVRQLDGQQLKLVEELKQQKKHIFDLEDREKGYVERISDLEQQLQKEREIIENLKPLQGRNEQVENFARNIDELTLEQERLHILVAEKDTEIEGLTKTITELRESRSQDVEVSKLATALESEQLGASRAISQNQQLKLQLTDMENAFVSLSNAKLDLTEQLQAERSIGRKLNVQLNKMETVIEDLRGKLKEKEVLLLDYEKERLQNAQIADQMQHYQAQSQNFSTFQNELQQALTSIGNLQKERADLLEKLQFPDQHNLENGERNNKEHSTNEENITKEGNKKMLEIQTNEENETNQGNYKILEIRGSEESRKILENERNEENKTVEESKINEESKTVLGSQRNGNNNRIEENGVMVNEVVISGRVEEDFWKTGRGLEERFKETMEKVAELTEEKQKLEHLVLQLQSETDTIGEYITLYQRQRAVLQGRAREREQAFRELLEERNQQQEQLHKLKIVLSEFLTKKHVSKTENTTDNTEDKVPENKTADEEDVADSKENGVSELFDLLTEIKDCKDSSNFSPNFHPCPWCSGKLITV